LAPHSNPSGSNHPSDRDTEALERAWDAFEAAELDKAAEAVQRLMRRTGGHPEVRFLRGALLLEEDAPDKALEEFDACANQVEDRLLLAFYRGLALFDLARFEEAEAALLQAVDLDPGSVRYELAQVREHLGRFADAERDYAAAHAVDAEAFPLPLRVSATEFEEAIHSGRERLPGMLRDRLDEVPVVVEDLPPRAILTHTEGGDLTPDLLGLFVGRNIREESVFEVPGIPPAIYLYKRNLERACPSREELVAEIETTLYHELGHYLGFEEDELHDLDVG